MTILLPSVRRRSSADCANIDGAATIRANPDSLTKRNIPVIVNLLFLVRELLANNFHTSLIASNHDDLVRRRRRGRGCRSGRRRRRDLRRPRLGGYLLRLFLW